MTGKTSGASGPALTATLPHTGPGRDDRERRPHPGWPLGEHLAATEPGRDDREDGSRQL